MKQFIKSNYFKIQILLIKLVSNFIMFKLSDTTNNDGWSSVCTVEVGWTWNSTTPTHCMKCGNRIKEDTESCDDGNLLNGDGWNSSCNVETGWTCNEASPTVCQKWGNGIKEGTEAWDDGNANSGDGWSNAWAIENGWTWVGSFNTLWTNLCGNCLIDNGEACDDWNSKNYDGWSSSCYIENGWSCKVISNYNKYKILKWFLFHELLYDSKINKN